MRQRPCFFLLLVLLPALAGCTRSAGLFSEQNARSHVSMLAGTIGSRPVGSEANARARAYVIDQLRLYGYEVRVQEADARRAEMGRTAHVSNIIAVLPGSRPDDGLGVAVSLEAARVLAARRDRQWTTLVLVTDGEESGLMGAAALVTDRDVASALHAYINIEAAGSSGPAMLFEAGPANGWLTGPWARNAPHPRGGSFGIEVYRRLPNDTDFTLLARQNIPGLNFALAGDGYAYHTARDVPDRLPSRTLRTTGENIVAVVTALDRIDITQRGKWGATFFDIGGIAAVSYSMMIGWLIAAASLLAGVVVWVRITAAALRVEGGWRWVFTAVWSAAGAAATAGMMVGATWALRAAREVYHPWYAHPDRMFLLLMAVGTTTGWTMSRVGTWLPARMRGLRHPIVTWSLALPLWLALASYLWTLPLLIASGLLLVTPSSNAIAIRMISIVVLGVAGTLWLQNTVDLLRFAAAVFGRLPIVTPVYVYAVIMSGAGVMIVPPFIAAATGTHPVPRPSFVTAMCLLSIAMTAGFAAVAPAYTFDQPLRRHVRALQEADGMAAIWEVASIEPGLDLAPGAPEGWSRQSTAAPASIPWGRLAHPFVFRTTGPSLGPAPIDIAGFTVTPVQAGVELTLTAVPRRAGLAVSFVLPAGITPARSSLPGALRLGRWTAVFIAPPAEGVVWRASFARIDATRLRDVHVAVTDFGFPGGTGWQRLPAWLPQEHAVWTAAATWVVSAVQVRPLEPVPPLR